MRLGVLLLLTQLARGESEQRIPCEDDRKNGKGRKKGKGREETQRQAFKAVCGSAWRKFPESLDVGGASGIRLVT